MRHERRYIAFAAGVLFLLVNTGWAQDYEDSAITVKKDWFYKDNEKVFIKGVCFFENHEVEGRFQRSSLEIMDHEFKRIKDAGFNAIRSQLRPEELELAQKHGLMVLQAANLLFFSKEYMDSHELEHHGEMTRETARYSKEYDNILFYIIDNEPQINEGVLKQGLEPFYRFHQRLIDGFKQVHPAGLVTMASYPPAHFLDHARYDVMAVNLYPHSPADSSIGNQKYLQWLKKHHAPEKPLVVTEYGYEVSEPLNRFAATMVQCLDEQLAAGVTGSFLYTWRAFGKEGKEDNRWYGLIPNRGKKNDHKNPSREVIDKLRTYFEAVVIEPKITEVYQTEIPVKVYGTDRTYKVQAEIGKQLFDLKRQGTYWWETAVPCPAGRKQKAGITVRAFDKNNNLLSKKTVQAYSGNYKKTGFEHLSGPEETDRQSGYRGMIKVTDTGREVLKNTDLVIGINQTGRDIWSSRIIKGRTDEQGIYRLVLDNLKPGYLTIMIKAKVEEEELAEPYVRVVKVNP